MKNAPRVPTHTEFYLLQLEVSMMEILNWISQLSCSDTEVMITNEQGGGGEAVEVVRALTEIQHHLV